MLRRRDFMITGLGSAILAGALPVQAADYPSKPVRLVVPYAPGGASDIVARLVAANVGPDFGQQIVVENMPGGSGVVGAQHVARAAPDGYTMLFSVGSFQILPSTKRAATVGFDIRKDFEPLYHLGKISSILIVNPAISPIRTIADLIAYAKEHPEELAYASNGAGSSTQLQAELLEQMAGIKLQHIPYQGSGPQTTALLAGEVPLSMDGIGPTQAHLKSGKLIALGITAAEPNPELPDVPPIAKTVPGYEADSMLGLMLPAKTPRPVIDKLHAAIAGAFKQQTLLQRYSQLGLVPVNMTPEEFRIFIADDVEKWADIIKKGNLVLD